MDNILEKIYILCTIYVFFMWAMFVLDNFIYLILRLLHKEVREESIYAFSNAFMQRNKETDVIMAVVNLVAYCGFAMWIVNLLK